MAGTKESSPGNLHKPIILKKTKPLAVVRVSRTTLPQSSNNHCEDGSWDTNHGWRHEPWLSAVDQVLKAGFRTIDIADATTRKENILGTEAMGDAVLKFL